jgi:adenylate kinase
LALNLLLLGPQGAGKGTQAERIAAEYGIPHIASGEILREHIARETDLGRRVKPIYDRGDLVPDELMIAIIRDRLSRGDTLPGFVLDGFPRTLPQAEALDEMLAEIDRELTLVLELQVDDSVSRERLLRRTREEGRSDDTPEAIDKRLALYHEKTAPLVSYYRAQGKLVGVPAEGTVDEVFAAIERVLNQAESLVRQSGPVEGVWGNREVPPARKGRS